MNRRLALQGTDMSTQDINGSLRSLRGIGEKTEKLFGNVGVHDLEQLLHYYPREYDAFETPVLPGEAVSGCKNAVRGTLRAKPSVKTFGRNSVTMAWLKDESGSLQVNWFHMPFLRNTLQVGAPYVFRGPVVFRNGRRIMEHPEVFREDEYRSRCGTLLPVYALTKGLTNNMVRKAVSQLLEAGYREEEFLPDSLMQSLDLIPLQEALRMIHFPEDRDILLSARRRLVFDEFFLFMLGVYRLREINALEGHSFPMRAVWKTEDVIESLPYFLTAAQQRVWHEVESDLQSGRLMNRLIQGDVGSGKTILAFLAMIMAYENGFQSVLMAPTEVLAAQHYSSLTALLEKNGLTEARPVLLTGGRSAADKRRIRQEIAAGEARMIIGTHALIQESVAYERLGLVITDEQHRFGVRQRQALEKKGEPPHVLVMSATPIPRTLAMILYGDLDISLLDDMPASRLPVRNCVVNTSWRANAWHFMEKELAAGHQVYVICPMVSPNEELQCENVTETCAAMKKHFGKTARVEMLHGQMRPKQKNEIMQAFADGDIRVLVSTTVIEVGVNVPNATVILIENAERFGLAQLHQLRGRVGRGSSQSYCIFMQGDERPESAERLQVLNRSTDGFFIAEEDLRLRGPGDLLGVRQSGEALFGIADIYRDRDVLQAASAAAQEILREDPGLEADSHLALQNALRRYLERQNDGGTL